MSEPFQYGDYPLTKSTQRYLDQEGIGDPVALVQRYLKKQQAKIVKEPPKSQDLNDKGHPSKDGIRDLRGKSINFDIARMI